MRFLTPFANRKADWFCNLPHSQKNIYIGSFGQRFEPRLALIAEDEGWHITKMNEACPALNPARKYLELGKDPRGCAFRPLLGTIGRAPELKKIGRIRPLLFLEIE